MIFVTGPLYAGKREYICRALHWSPEELARLAVWDAQELVRDASPETVLQTLCDKAVVIATEIGGGVVPVDPAERAYRERAGRLACLLAARADTVIRVCCGLPQLLKGEWPCASC